MKSARVTGIAGIALALLCAVAGCGDDDESSSTNLPVTEDGHAPCVARNPLRSVYYGDLHVHTTYSFDAHAFDVQTTPQQAYAFARGAAVQLPPLDASGHGTQTLRLARPLDFAAVTDHSEFLGEVEACTTPGSAGYDSTSCRTFRAGGNQGVGVLGALLAFTHPRRAADICGDGAVCRDAAGQVWQRIQDAAEGAYDRSAQCSFTSFVAYEYSAGTSLSTLHRNVLFRNAHVPFPTTYFEQPTPLGLWRELKTTCLDAGIDCDTLAIPHNSNESNGHMFFVEYPGATSVDEERAQAELRATLEPVVEIYQHKGDSECMNGLSGILGQPDELCTFEKRRKPPFDDCGDGKGTLGTTGLGCVSRYDFVRNALLFGLTEQDRLGVNPYRLGITASTDTHNGTPGATEENTFIGHRGADDDTPEKQLGSGALYPGGIIFSPGGLTGVWAEENSRNSIFDALKRREVFGTSGTRIAVRFFGGWEYGTGLCDDPRLLDKAYAGGVAMGGTLALRPQPATSPTFILSALRDSGTSTRPGVGLQRLQIIKGWIADGQPHQKVFDAAGGADNGAAVDTDTCTPLGTGADALCTVWSDPEFDPAQRAFYYARVIENPSCRWSTYTCNRLPTDQRPPACTDPAMPKTIQERAWTSPIWYEPALS
jgi:uncharacterized protein DUF3604